jgi:hypothetical protein
MTSIRSLTANDYRNEAAGTNGDSNLQPAL